MFMEELIGGVFFRIEHAANEKKKWSKEKGRKMPSSPRGVPCTLVNMLTVKRNENEGEKKNLFLSPSISFGPCISIHLINPFSTTTTPIVTFISCADVSIKGVKNGKLPSKMMKMYDFKAKGVKTGVTFPGDGKSHDRGAGPSKSEISQNTR